MKNYTAWIRLLFKRSCVSMGRVRSAPLPQHLQPGRCILELQQSQWILQMRFIPTQPMHVNRDGQHIARAMPPIY
ncbi:UNVERIFIED_CONTAM: hypothetical protein K2H54_020850 [Gekko kuhli]